MLKFGDGQTSPFPERTYPTVSVKVMPGAVRRLRTATLTRIFATRQAAYLAVRHWPKSLIQLILLSTEFLRRYLPHRRQSELPWKGDALTPAFRARARTVLNFHDLAFLRGGVTV